MKHLFLALAISVPLVMAPVAFGQQTTPNSTPASTPSVREGHVNHGDSVSHGDVVQSDMSVSTASPSKSTAPASKAHRKPIRKSKKKATVRSKQHTSAKKTHKAAASNP